MNPVTDPLANPLVDPLKDLRDIHLPEAIGWWPPAPGWWLLLGMVLILIAAVVYWFRKRKVQGNQAIVFSNQDVMQAGLLELDAIEKRAPEDTRQTVADLSKLLRRCALQLARLMHQSHDVAGLTGEAWLSWLDSHWQRDDFTQGTGRILIDAPYRKSMPDNTALTALCEISRAWLEHRLRHNGEQ